MLDLLFNFDELLTFGVDAVVYSALALIGSLLFILRLGFSVFGGVDSDFDMEVDSGSDASFGFVSVLSILAFFMGSGWMGLACVVSWGMGHFASGLAAAGFGTTMMVFAASMMFGLRKLTTEARYDLQTAVGHTGQVYLTIPAKGKGRGQVTVTVSGRKKVLPASSTGKEIKAFTAVKVVAVNDDGCMIVEKQ